MNGTKAWGGLACVSGRLGTTKLLAGLEYVEAENVETADFILVTGPRDLMSSAEPYDDMLAAARERGLPMVCANPDLEVIRGGVRKSAPARLRRVRGAGWRRSLAREARCIGLRTVLRDARNRR